MPASAYQAVFELRRGDVAESIHYGAAAVVSASGELLASWGKAGATTYLRSAAKPFQALPFIEAGGHEHFGLSSQEVALLCASHSGTDEHLEVLQSIQAKTGLGEGDLKCGTHPPYHQATVEAIAARGEAPTPNRHNCSGKHSGMLAFAKLNNWPLESYLDEEHPVQQAILAAFAGMCDLQPAQVAMGIDGCSAPNFAVPLRNVALGYARLVQPSGLPAESAQACQTITAAMTANPAIVGGPDRFDTRLMETTHGRVLCKGGAEGFQGIGIFPGAVGEGSPALGVALKIADGDRRGRVRAAVTLELLRQLGALRAEELEALSAFGPRFPVKNWRKLIVGEGGPTFELQREDKVANLQHTRR